ncbi:hypothetical protein [Stenotrophomonas sp. PS02300]|uniref:hypothetical protein n=1 Tax=Stenotrophomonas sp. PS02300 TaxID=2991426 RepID=UPI002499D4DD|nr:hypothetical protein [Stenotrophomonas sp. PS02300]
MIFLIHYDRKNRKLSSLSQFETREDAASAKLQIEIETLSSALNQEVVVLEAESEDSLRRTHQRYFNTLGKLRDTEGSTFSEKASSIKFWMITETNNTWNVKAEGMPSSTYASKEQAVAAASLDAKSWTSSTGRSSGYRVRAADLTFTEEIVFHSK